MNFLEENEKPDRISFDSYFYSFRELFDILCYLEANKESYGNPLMGYFLSSHWLFTIF